MAGCSHCGSDNFRVQEPGMLNNSYYCLDCKRSFERLSPGAKNGLLGGAIAVGAGILHGLFGGGDNSGNA